MRQARRGLSQRPAITHCSQIDRKVQQGNKNARTGLISFMAGCAQDGRSDCSSRGEVLIGIGSNKTDDRSNGVALREPTRA